jgi:putative membrane protein
MLHKIVLAAKGFCMGAADVVPGVSGGTMAFILGIYTQLLAAIRSFDMLWLKAVLTLNVRESLSRPHFGFLLPLGIGLISAVIFFTRIIPLPKLLHTHPEPIYGLFFGLVLGSIITLLAETKKITGSDFFFLVSGAVVGWFTVNLVPTETPDGAWFIFISGMIAITAMILPGLSGSFLLLIMKKYDVILNGIGHFQLNIIIPFGLGAVTGLVVFSRFLSWLLSRFYQEALLSIVGILIGTLWIIWPFQIRHYIVAHGKQKLISSTPFLPNSFDQTVLYALLMFIFGLGLVIAIHQLERRFRIQD